MKTKNNPIQLLLGDAVRWHTITSGMQSVTKIAAGTIHS